MGAAGAGKSVQGKYLAQQLACRWISIGELLRATVNESVKQKMLAGYLLEDSEIFAVLSDELAALPSPSTECILDGFLRTTGQARWLVEEAHQQLVTITGIIHLVIPHPLALERLLKRGRPDDHEAVIARRFEEYDKTILPIIEYLTAQGLEIKEVDGEGSVEAVHQRIVEALHV
jgi:adenylate kinase family enzyme